MFFLKGIQRMFKNKFETAKKWQVLYLTLTYEAYFTLI